MKEIQIGKSDLESFSASEPVQSSSLSLESVNDIDGGDSLSLGVLSVGDRVSDDVFQERPKNCSCLIVDQGTDPLDSSSASKSSDGWLGDTHDHLFGHGLTMATSGSFSLSELSGLSSFSLGWWHVGEVESVM